MNSVRPIDTSKRVWIDFDPYHPPENADVEFRLTYAGQLHGNGDAKHKQELRRVFHQQLKTFWQLHPALKRWSDVDPSDNARKPRPQALAEMFQRNGYRFAPLATKNMPLLVSLDILFLRPDPPGQLLRSADLDNRLKTLFDALRMPENQAELGGYNEPALDENPFYCLMEDDRQVANVVVSTDTLLEPVQIRPPGHSDKHDARLIITVGIKSYVSLWSDPFH